MNISDYAQQILEGSTLEDKLLPKCVLHDDIFSKDVSDSYVLKKNPGRTEKLKFSNKQVKFPKRQSFKSPDKRALALHFFANHELLATEMMAAFLLIYPHTTKEQKLMKRGVLGTLVDEQKHLRLYLKRMEELGVEFGDFPLNDFFWKQLQHLKTPAQFFALMSLTFESANLDFSFYYQNVFKEVEDFESSRIMKIVYDDEISHVALGATWLEKWKNDKLMWDYYMELLPDLITPARSKGIQFLRKARLQAGLDESFVSSLENYRDTFAVTHRRQWKR